MAAELLNHIVYINLDERTDRKTHFAQEIEKLNGALQGSVASTPTPLSSSSAAPLSLSSPATPPTPLNPVRIPATKTAQGAMGCSMSHIKAVQYAKDKGWPQVFVCEDDITFTNPSVFIDSLNKCSKRRGWDVLIVAGNNWPPFYPVSDYCIRVNNCISTTGYIVKQKYYDTLLANYKEGVKMFLHNPAKGYLYAIDVYWRKLQIRDKWFMAIPATVDQWNNSYSNVENKVLSYSGLMLDYKKTNAWLQPETREKVMKEMAALGKPLIIR